MGGRFGFQFRYDVIRLNEKSAGLLAEFRDFMSSPDVVQVMRQIVGAGDIAFADAHASRYQPGHFLTTHDDHLDTMGRRAAYVMNLTPKWRPDWGGLLQFFDRRGDVVRAFTPGYNLLNLFRVPQAHNVSWVTPLAAAPRYAVTGWLRAET
jgi:Rps23 Pro-64 3,4-dihydroxylase Tpa1-like proline 4-hydroxylase